MMKAFVFGALLVQTLHHKSLMSLRPRRTLLPTNSLRHQRLSLSSGPDAPSEAEVSSEAAFDAGADATADAAASPTADGSFSETTPFADESPFPIGTADVIVEQTSSQDPDAFQATPVSVGFGSGATPGAGVTFNGMGWTLPQA